MCQVTVAVYSLFIFFLSFFIIFLESGNSAAQREPTFLQVAQNELQLRQGVDADQVGLHLLAGFLSCVPVVLLRGQLVAARLEGLPAHVALVLLIVRPRVCGGAEVSPIEKTVLWHNRGLFASR